MGFVSAAYITSPPAFNKNIEGCDFTHMSKQEMNYRVKAILLGVVNGQLAAPETRFVKQKYDELTSKYGEQRAKESDRGCVDP